MYRACVRRGYLSAERSSSVADPACGAGLADTAHVNAGDVTWKAPLESYSGAAFAESMFPIAQNFRDFIAQFPARRRDQTDAASQAFRRC